jgi:hypothetical protein
LQNSCKTCYADWTRKWCRSPEKFESKYFFLLKWYLIVFFKKYSWCWFDRFLIKFELIVFKFNLKLGFESWIFWINLLSRVKFNHIYKTYLADKSRDLRVDPGWLSEKT